MVQKRQLEHSQSVENAQSNNFIETHNMDNLVSIDTVVSDPDSEIIKKQSVNLKLKNLKKRKYKLRKKNKMKATKDVEAIEHIEELKATKDIETVEHIEELKQENGSSSKDNLIVEGTIKCILSFIKAFFNLMTVIFKGSPGFIWGIIFLFAFKAALSQAAPTSTNDVSTQTSLSNMLAS